MMLECMPIFAPIGTSWMQTLRGFLQVVLYKTALETCYNRDFEPEFAKSNLGEY
jgi:hypothetical protein